MGGGEEGRKEGKIKREEEGKRWRRRGREDGTAREGGRKDVGGVEGGGTEREGVASSEGKERPRAELCMLPPTSSFKGESPSVCLTPFDCRVG